MSPRGRITATGAGRREFAELSGERGMLHGSLLPRSGTESHCSEPCFLGRSKESRVNVTSLGDLSSRLSVTSYFAASP